MWDLILRTNTLVTTATIKTLRQLIVCISKKCLHLFDKNTLFIYICDMFGVRSSGTAETKPIYGYSLTAELLGDCGGNFYRMSNVRKIAIPKAHLLIDIQF